MKNIFIIIGIVGGIVAGSVMTAQPAQALDLFGEACQPGSTSPICASRGNNGDDVPSLLNNIISTLLTLIGIVSVIMIIVGGIRYVLADGDSSKIATAKNTILYAVAGLVVAISAYAITAFVISSL